MASVTRAMRTVLLAGLAASLASVAAAQEKVPEALLLGDGDKRVIIELAAPSRGGRQEAFANPESYVAGALTGSARQVEAIGAAPLVVAEVDEAALSILAADANVRRVYEDRLMAPLLRESTALLKAPEVWAADATGSGVAIAVLDTGVEPDHPFLSGRIVAEGCFSTNSPSAPSFSLCPGGEAAATTPGSASSCDFESVSPACVHGTHVAGIALGAKGATEAGEINGVAPGADLIAVQVFSRFVGEAICGEGVGQCVNAWTSDVLRGLLFVESLMADHTIAAVNLSLGGGNKVAACDADSPYAELFDRLTAAGVAVIAAAGNSANVGAVAEPACINSAVTVTATDKQGAIDTTYADVSPLVDLVAPGSKILSSAAARYVELDGTSMAAPHVAGLFALMRARHGEADVAALLAAMQSSGTLVTDERIALEFALPDAEATLAALDGAAGLGPGEPEAPAGCAPNCVEVDPAARRVIFVLGDRGPVAPATLDALRVVFGEGTEVADIGDGKLVIELPEGTTQSDLDRARRAVGGDPAVFEDRPLQTLQPGGRIQIR